MNSAPRLAYVHIGKSAGSWLRTELEAHYRPDEICHHRFQHQFDADREKSYLTKKFFSAHIGGDLAATLDATLITVLRSPFDRIVSLFYYWKAVDGGPDFVRDLSLELFLTNLVERSLVDVHNTQAWQIAFGHLPDDRRRYAGVGKQELYEAAVARLDDFKVVGIFEDLEDVRNQLWQTLQLPIASPAATKVNVTSSRRSVSDLTVAERSLIYGLTDVDLALYDHVAGMVRRRQRAAADPIERGT